VRLHWKILRFGLFAAFLMVVTAGCGGLNVTKSISPLDFFMPGLLKADPPAASPDLREFPSNDHAIQLA
jgi:hypothetical protein